MQENEGKYIPINKGHFILLILFHSMELYSHQIEGGLN
jgi:hypothetical protein